MKQTNPLAQGICQGIRLAYSGSALDWAEANVKFPASDRASHFDRTVAPWMNEPLLAATDDETTQVFIRAATGAGKCLGIGTPILMFDGTIKPVEQVRVGDKLIGPDSKPRLVLSLARGREEMFRVTPTKGDSYVVNKSHILSLRMTGVEGGAGTRGAGKIENISVSDYLEKNKTYKHCMKGWRTAVDFESKEEIHWSVTPYILGLWLGDGSSEGPRWFGIDHEVWQELADHALFCGMKFRNVKRGDSCPEVTITSPQGAGKGHRNIILETLREMSLIKNKHVPLKYKVASRKNRLELLAGLMDTDGSLSRNGFDYISQIESLADDICFLARSVGLAAYKTPCIKTCSNNGVAGQYYRVSISGDCEIVPCRIARKKAALRLQKKNVLNVGISVESIGVGDYYGFQIDGDGLFLLGDFTVTHNTTFMETLACFIVAQKPGPTLFVGQTDDMVKDWTESRLLPIFRECEPVRALFPEDRHALRKTTILFPHMVLFAGGANMTNLQEKSMRYCIGDEVWRWRSGMIKELKARHHDRWNRKTILVSQGWDSPGESDEEWDSGTREVYGWECPKCKTWQRYLFDSISWDNDAKDEKGGWLWDRLQDSIRMTCEHCKAQYKDSAAERRALSTTASYRPLNPHPVRGVRSFEIPAYAVWWVPWFALVREWLDANESKRSGNLEPLKQFVQKRKAQVWVEEVVSDLPEIACADYGKSEYLEGQKIDGEVHRFLAVDKQRDHFWCVVRAFRADGSSRLLHESRPLTWEMLDAISSQYAVPARCNVVDAGYDTPLVYEACARRGWTASHGSGQDGFWHQQQERRVRRFVSKIEAAQAGSHGLKAAYFFFSNEKIKDRLSALRQPDSIPEWEVARDVSDDYRKQMLAEMKRDVINAKTKQVEQRWVRIGGRPNHLWDCECIALAAAMLAGVLPTGE